MQSITPLATVHKPARKFVHDDYLAVFDNVIHIFDKHVVCLQRIVDQVGPIHVAGRVKTLHASQLFSLSHTLICERRIAVFFVDRVVQVFLQTARNAVRFCIFTNILVGRSGYNQRCPRFIDQNIVDLVDERKVQRSLRLLIRLLKTIIAPSCRSHIVTQIVETKLVVGSIRNIAIVSGLFPRNTLVGLDRVDRQSQTHVERPHPFHITTGQVIVYRYNVHTFIGNGIEIRRQCGDKRLTLTRHHFGDCTTVQHHAPNQLHVIMTHTQKSLTGFSTCSKRLKQYVIFGFACLETFTKAHRLLFQLLIGHRRKLGLQTVDRINSILQAFYKSCVG